jgi:predicted nucleic acid-binding Zn ribbon protein
MDPCRTLSPAVSDQPRLRVAPEPEPASQRLCVVCGQALRSRRASARTCSSRCRSRKSRDRRLRDLTQRLEVAELRLREAADTLCEYRDLVERGVGGVAP